MIGFSMGALVAEGTRGLELRSWSVNSLENHDLVESWSLLHTMSKNHEANPAGFVAYPLTGNRWWTSCQLRNSLEHVAG